MVQIRKLSASQITQNMFMEFRHCQRITKKWVKKSNWELVQAEDTREWDEEKRTWIATYLCQQIERGGTVLGAYSGELLVGFCCLDGYLIGKTAKYANLTMLFVDDSWKRKQIGKNLFEQICKYALNMGAEKLFMSAIPSNETIAFYFSVGCEDARELIEAYIDSENDRYLELTLKP